MIITLLGTGTPAPSPDRFGSAILVEAGGELLLFDCGRGAAIRMEQAQKSAAATLRSLFLTHLHSDHVVGLPDVWLTGWILGRKDPLRVWGPDGTAAMTAHLRQAYAADLLARQSPAENLPSAGADLQGRDVQPGVAYETNGVRVVAFLVDHGHVAPAFGYRIEHGGHSVVISGDTKLSETLIAASLHADVLVHSAWMTEARNSKPPALRSIASAEEAGQVFARVKPKLAAVYHYADEAGLEAAVRKFYHGPLVIGRDRMVIEVDRTTTWRDAR
jgi:ribonuclease Z